MFSLENTLEQLIIFFKKFLLTFYTVFFKSKSLLSDQIERSTIIKPSLYLLISLFLFMAYVRLDYNINYKPFETSLKVFFGFLDQQNLSTKSFYILPLGISLYILIYLFSKILFRQNTLYFEIYKIFNFYWIGTSLILATFIQFFIIALATFSVTVSKTFDVIIFYFLVSCSYLLPFIFSLKALKEYVKKENNLVRFKFYTASIIIPFSISFCGNFLNYFIPLTELKEKDKIKIMGLSSGGEPNFTIESNCLNVTCDTLILSGKIVIQNLGQSVLIVEKDNAFFLKSYLDKNYYDWPKDSNIIPLSIIKFESDSLIETKYLKPNELTLIKFKSKVKSKTFNKLLIKENKQFNRTFRLQLYYYPNGITNYNNKFESEIFLSVDTVANN